MRIKKQSMVGLASQRALNLRSPTHRAVGVLTLGNVEPLACSISLALRNSNVRWEDFDRDRAIETCIPGFVDLAHPAGSKECDDLIRAESGAGRKRHDGTGGEIIRSNHDAGRSTRRSMTGTPRLSSSDVRHSIADYPDNQQ